jgi:hypothetical protein
MKRHAFIALGVVAAVLMVLLVLAAANPQRRHTPLLPLLKSEAQWRYNELTYQYEMHKAAARERAFEKAIESGRAVRIAVPYRPGQTGAWIGVERAIGSFASSNRVELIRFEGAGNTGADVCVWAKDATAMRRFVNSLADGANQHLQPTPR